MRRGTRNPTRLPAMTAALVEGNSIRATVRMTNVSKPTILNLLAEPGAACTKYQDQTVRNVRANRVQVDEIWQFDHVWSIEEIVGLGPGGAGARSVKVARTAKRPAEKRAVKKRLSGEATQRHLRLSGTWHSWTAQNAERASSTSLRALRSARRRL